MHIEKDSLKESMYFSRPKTMDKKKQLYKLSEEIYRLLYHVRYLEVCCSYNIIPHGFFVNKNPCKTKK